MLFASGDGDLERRGLEWVLFDRLASMFGPGLLDRLDSMFGPGLLDRGPYIRASSSWSRVFFLAIITGNGNFFSRRFPTSPKLLFPQKR